MCGADLHDAQRYDREFESLPRAGGTLGGFSFTMADLVAGRFNGRPDGGAPDSYMEFGKRSLASKTSVSRSDRAGDSAVSERHRYLWPERADTLALLSAQLADYSFFALGSFQDWPPGRDGSRRGDFGVRDLGDVARLGPFHQRDRK